MKRQGDLRDIRIAHAPLMTKSIYGERFLKGLTDTNETLPDDLVVQKSLDLLGLLEAYQRIEKTADPNVRREREKGERAQVRAGERILAMQTPEDLLSLDMEDEAGPDAESSPTLREHLTAKIRGLLSSRQVREYFLSHLRAEAERYASARPKLIAVEKMRRARDTAFRLMNRIYLESTKRPGSGGRLDAVAKEKISAIAAMDKAAHEREDAERASASESERGFLLAQRLLRYKQQYEKDRFVLTPSRQELVRRISEYVLAGKKVFLVGPTGTGKTQLALYVADATSGKYEVVSWHEGTTPRDLFGYRELWTDDAGRIQSGTKPGPVARAVSSGATAIHDEYTAGSTRSQIAAKYLMNARPGGRVQIPGFNGEIFEVGETFAEIYTGNPKDERTKEREDMDPAILRMLSGIAVDFMPEDEMRDIILSRLIESNGVLRFSRGEIALVGKLAKAAELMQLFHDRSFGDIRSRLPANEFSALESIFGKIDDARLDKNFLDPGTLFGLFDGLDATLASGGSLSSHLESRLVDFLHDPKADTVPEERALAARILTLSGVLASARVERGAVSDVRIAALEEGNPFVLPSELSSAFGENMRDENPFATAEETPETVAAVEAPPMESLLRDMFTGWYGATDAAKAVITNVGNLAPKDIGYTARKSDTDASRFGEYTMNPDMQGVDFEKAKVFTPDLSAFNGRPIHEVMEHIQTTYGAKYRLPGLEYMQWATDPANVAKVPADLKDGKYHFFPGSVLRGRDGDWFVPYALWLGSGFGRSRRWLRGGWGADYRVVLLER